MDRAGEGTKFTIDRKLFTSDIWFASPWKLKIWIYLIGNANHTAGSFMGIDIDRGQLIRSYRTISSDCGYKIGYRLKKPSIDTVRRICEALAKEERITLRSVQHGTLFTILNYNDLQPMPEGRSVQRKQEGSYSDRTTPVHNKNDKNDKNDKKYFSYQKKVPIPSNIELLPFMEEYAKSKGIGNGAIPQMFEDFCIWHTKHGTKYKNWSSTWQSWVLKGIKIDPGIVQPKQTPLEDLMNDD